MIKSTSNPRCTSMPERTVLAAASAVLLLVLPIAAQEVDGIEWDPGFDHNHVGRTIGGANSGFPHDPGTYCGPLPSHACGGGRSLSQMLISGHDPYRPVTWATHRGNEWTRDHAEKKGLPLQSLVVRTADGAPAADVPVRFYQAGYNKKGIAGRTDDKGLFVVSLKKTDKNHRFLIEAEGYRRARLDVLGHGVAAASHQVVLEPVGRRADSLWEATNSPHQIAVLGDDAVPADLARDYKKAVKALDRGDYDVAVVELKTLVERWPVGTLEEGGTYEPRRLLIEALEASGQASVAETLEQRRVVVTSAAAQVTG